LPVLNYSINQLPSLLDFIEKRRAWTSQGRNLGRQTFQEILEQPGLTPEANCFLLEEKFAFDTFTSDPVIVASARQDKETTI